MKNLLNLALLLAFAFFASCGSDNSKKQKPAPPKVKKEAPAPEKPVAEEVKQEEEEPEEEAPKTEPTPPEHLEKAREVIASVSDDAVAAVDAKKKYKMFCAACHGFTGDLNVNGAKDLTASKISLEESVAQVYHGKGLMTPFKGIMKDEEIVAVAKYIETLR